MNWFGGRVVEPSNGREHGRRTIFTFSARKNNTFVSQRHTPWGSGWIFEGGVLHEDMACRLPCSDLIQQKKSPSPKAWALTCLLYWYSLPSRGGQTCNSGAMNRGQGEAAACSPVAGKTWPFKLLFKTEHLPLDHRDMCSSSWGVWCKVCVQAGMRGQMNRDKFVAVLIACFTDCRAPLSVDPKAFEPLNKSHRSQSSFLWSLASNCLQIPALKVRELKLGSL